MQPIRRKADRPPQLFLSHNLSPAPSLPRSLALCRSTHTQGDARGGRREQGRKVPGGAGTNIRGSVCGVQRGRSSGEKRARRARMEEQQAASSPSSVSTCLFAGTKRTQSISASTFSGKSAPAICIIHIEEMSGACKSVERDAPQVTSLEGAVSLRDS